MLELDGVVDIENRLMDGLKIGRLKMSILSCLSLSEAETWMLVDPKLAWHDLLQVPVNAHPQGDIKSKGQPRKEARDPIKLYEKC
jgi:hypothetical protein